MGTRAESKKARLLAALAERKPERIDEALAEELRAMLAPVSGSYLRQLLRDTGLPLAPCVEGVNLHSIETVERTLTALEEEYARSDMQRRRAIRALVIEAKDRHRWNLNREKDEMRRAEKDEALLWLMTWLENPELFRVWAALRKRKLAPF